MAATRTIIPQMAPIYDRLTDLSWLLFRAFYGYLFMPHGAQKLFQWFGGGGLAKTAEGFDRMGIQPGWFWADYIGCLEFFGGFLMLIGLFTRPIAALLFGFMFVAATYATVGNGYFWSKGGIEMPLLLSVLALVILVRGGGRFSVDALIGREF